MSPPNQTDLSPEETAHEHQSVQPLSKAVRAEVCWEGRQEIRAVIEEEGVVCEGGEACDGDEGGEDVELETRFSPVTGEKITSTSSHQSISTTFSIPHS